MCAEQRATRTVVGLVQVIFKQGETDMGDRGKKDKGNKEQQKKSVLNPKEKRKMKKEKKNHYRPSAVR